MKLALIAGFVPLVAATSAQQQVFADARDVKNDAFITSLLAEHDDLVTVMKLLHPASAAELDKPRLLQVFDEEAVWMNEGDKMRLRKSHEGFVDLTEFQDLHRKDAYATHGTCSAVSTPAR